MLISSSADISALFHSKNTLYVKAVAPQSSLISPHSHFLFQTFTSQTPLLMIEWYLGKSQKIMNISINTVIGTLVINESNGSLCKVFINFPSGAQVVCVWRLYICNIPYTSYLKCVCVCVCKRKLQVFSFVFVP